MTAWIGHWYQRHQHPANRVLHALGIPMLAGGLILGLVQLIQGRWDLWWRPVSLIALSYLLQWIGHRIEGNDLGEAVHALDALDQGRRLATLALFPHRQALLP